MNNGAVGIQPVELVVLHAEILLHSRYVSVADIGRVQVHNKIEETRESQEDGVELEHQTLFLFRDSI